MPVPPNGFSTPKRVKIIRKNMAKSAPAKAKQEAELKAKREAEAEAERARTAAKNAEKNMVARYNYNDASTDSEDESPQRFGRGRFGRGR